MKIDVRTDVRGATRMLGKMRRQIPYATHKAINDTLFDIMREEKKAMVRDLDRPTPFTQKGVRVERSKSKRQLSGEVYVPEIQSKYLEYQVEGGTRAPKKRAIPLAHKSLRNQYGNMPKGLIKGMLRDKQRYFSGHPKGWHGAPGGIWRRLGTTDKKGGHKLQFMVAWHPHSVKYKPRFHFYRIAQTVTDKQFEKNVRKQVARAINTAR